MPVPHDDAGSVSVFALIAATILVMFVGVAADLGGKVHTLQRAQDVARQAARAAAEAAFAPSAIKGDAASVDPGRAVQAGQAYLSAAGISGTVSVAGDTVTVQTTTTYTPVILGLAGIGTQTVTGESTARLERALQGVQR
ncbi:MAG: pilus assembly protein TadG-related protein [Kineosporiaceae bacterium]|jgi:Flp pilus assembly protein TadG